MAMRAEQALHGFPDHNPGEEEQERRLRQRRHAFNLAVAVVVLRVSRLARDAHRKVRHHGGHEIKERVRRLREDRERAGGKSDRAFGQRQTRRGRDGSERRLFLHVLHAAPGCAGTTRRQIASLDA